MLEARLDYAGERVKTTSILIADDHSVLRAGLRSLLNAEPGFRVVGEAADGAQAVILAVQLRPDVVVTDINMPGANGIEVTQELRDHLPDTRILILSMHEDSSLVRRALEAGASGYIAKRAAESELIHAVRAVAAGGTYIQPEVQRNVTIELLRNAVVAVPGGDSLSERERRLLGLLASGHTNRQLADLLGVDLATVAEWRNDLTEKLGLRSRIELLKYAREQGLL
jgi:DNA-binding NarL/FixJ family response regulator